MDYRVLFSCLKPGFFESEWIQNMDERIVCAELAMDLREQSPIKVPFTPQEGISFGFFHGDLKKIKEAVAKVEDNWVQYFTEYSEIFCAFDGDEIVSFCIIENMGVQDGVHVGGPGCVGTIPEYRERGIGLEMVRQATEILKERDYDLSWIHYTHIDKWYQKLGYKTVLRWNCYGITEEL